MLLMALTSLSKEFHKETALNVIDFFILSILASVGNKNVCFLLKLYI